MMDVYERGYLPAISGGRKAVQHQIPLTLKFDRATRNY